MIELKELYKHILTNGEKRDTRSGMTRSVWNETLTFRQLEHSGFPVPTSKKLMWKAVVGELLWFLSGSSSINDLRRYTFGPNAKTDAWTIWSDDAKRWSENINHPTNGDDIGPVYGVSWRRMYAPQQEVVMVKKRTDRDNNFVYPFNRVTHPPIQCDLNTDECWAIGVVSTIPNNRYRVQLKSGFITEITRPNWKSLKKIDKIDGYAKTACGVGFAGEPVQDNTRLRTLWYNMIARCYNKDHPTYHMYGGVGVTVSPIWHSFEMFSKTISRVPGFHFWVKGGDYELDKDYYSSGVYSPNTTIFIPKNMNSELNGTPFVVNGETYLSVNEWAVANGVKGHNTMERWKAGKLVNGVSLNDVKFFDTVGDRHPRRKIVFDQMQNLIEGLKNEPQSRRHIVMAWNPTLVDEGALPPCHLGFQCYVTGDGKLNLHWWQRSVDSFLGLPFNIASYALLLHLLAKWTGLKPGDLSVWMGDVHLYESHLGAVDIYLNNPEFLFPDLELPEGTETLDSTIELTALDFENALVGYEHAGVVSAPLSVGT